MIGSFSLTKSGTRYSPYAMNTRLLNMLLILCGFVTVSLISATASAQSVRDPSVASNWQIGPWINWRGEWRNYSKGMPLRPTQAGESWYFDFPYPNKAAGHVHYLTYRHGPLEGARSIRLKYRIDAQPGTRFIPQEQPQQAATLSLYFQRSGDRWRGKAPYTGYRWYAPHARVVPLRRGTHEIVIPMTDPWISVLGKPRAEELRYFNRALERTDRVGFVFGSKSRRGHGVFATAPARFTMLEFEVR